MDVRRNSRLLPNAYGGRVEPAPDRLRGLAFSGLDHPCFTRSAGALVREEHGPYLNAGDLVRRTGLKPQAVA